jgi:crotonobetainyl-CoA:carnitine CoA-transferase CaiB-like acyl-CoA transferase
VTDAPPSPGRDAARLPLDGVRVIDIATLGAGPWLGTRLADFGAEVIKVEHPSAGDPMRLLGWFDGDVPLWWKVDARNKRTMTLDLKNPDGADILRRLVRDADVLIENFRPGTLERWGLGYDVLSTENPGLVMVRVTGWGQDGPMKDKPGFGTLAEAVSGWAHLNGFPENPPTLPPMGLGDALTSVLGAFATMVALYERTTSEDGRGQIVDLAIYESLFSLIGQQVILYDRLKEIPQRMGNEFPFVVPRNVYRTSDDRYVALAASTPSTFERLMRAIGRPELIDDPRFTDNAIRIEHRREMDDIVAAWMAEHTQAEILATCDAHETTVAPVYDIEQIFTDAPYAARGAIVTVDDEELGPTRVADVFPRLSRTPGKVRHLGQPTGSHTNAILAELGLDPARIEALREQNVI